MKYELIALDMDGTLLNKDLKIDQETIEAIHQATSHGKCVTIATGRTLTELKEYMQDLKDVRYFIVESGAAIYDRKTNSLLFQKVFQSDEVESLYQAFLKHDTMIFVCKDGYSYILKELAQKCGQYGLACYKEEFSLRDEYIEDLQEFLMKYRDKIEKISFHCRNYDEVLSLEETLKDVDVTKIEVYEDSLEVSPKGVHKGLGLLALCNHLHLDVNQTIAVGDSDNDIEILKVAGLPIAMANGNQHVKELAQVIVSDHNHQGVKEAIEKYLL